MSWNRTYPSRDAMNKNQAEFSSRILQEGDVVTPEIKAELEQVEAAKAAAGMLIDSGMFGDGSKSFRINLNGHANVGHVPAAGWGNDCVTVSIFQQ